ncbi:hypothetical protein AYO44_08120 [Planctomycetaceae bacterium SCGC AG-212-F19]|nr:hypothetical protein AYO44_08120 [Planctomycetaceae bacterium SCGC AG-212-F19]
MQQHPADCLRGPVRRGRGAWPAEAGPAATPPVNPADPDIRWDLVERIRREIAEGTYETEEKLEKALSRLLEELE